MGIKVQTVPIDQGFIPTIRQELKKAKVAKVTEPPEESLKKVLTPPQEDVKKVLHPPTEDVKKTKTEVNE